MTRLRYGKRGVVPHPLTDPILDLWLFGFTKGQIATVLRVEKKTVKAAVRTGQNNQDPRAVFRGRVHEARARRERDD